MVLERRWAMVCVCVCVEVGEVWGCMNGQGNGYGWMG